MIEVFCVGAVIYVTLDLLGSAYLIRRLGGFRATWQQVMVNIRSESEDRYGDECPEEECDCGSC